MTKEALDDHVRDFRYGVEGLAREEGDGDEAGEVRATWAMLAFALEDWR